MNINAVKNTVIRDISNLPGWQTKRKIVVIESDDWGSVRMPSLNVCKKLIGDGLDLEGGSKRYNYNDTLADKNDLTALFETLEKYKDKNNRSAVFTAVSVVANPDFKKIKEHDFSEYYYEPFTKTLERYQGDDAAFKLWKEGIQQKIFMPQFHAREHLNVAEWMRALQQKDREALLAFNEGVWGFNNKKISGSSISFQAAFDLYQPADLALQAASIREGLALFENLFGYKASFFVPPNGPFNNSLEKVAAACGIKYMSASKIQTEPVGFGKTKKVLHWLGKKNIHHQLYLTRNCFFEPSEQGKDWVDSCLANIASAFRWNKPAIISSHRVNYIGVLNKSNRESGLAQLNQLLRSIVNNWPSAEFYTSSELGDMIATDKKML
jgi:hypothetical protein